MKEHKPKFLHSGCTFNLTADVELPAVTGEPAEQFPSVRVALKVPLEEEASLETLQLKRRVEFPDGMILQLGVKDTF